MGEPEVVIRPVAACWPRALLVGLLCLIGLTLFHQGLAERRRLEPGAMAVPAAGSVGSGPEVRYLDQVLLQGPRLKAAGGRWRYGSLFLLGAAWMLAALTRVRHQIGSLAPRASALRALWLLPAAWALAQLAIHAGAAAPSARAATEVFQVSAPVLVAALLLAVPWTRSDGL